ncbi:mannose-P-dolichol utilization defect 1 protein-like [Dysidea avara]|uniref:mannose-P-dolichol utilization defect 1 protein-like n=1 Tax=Dysidea avara TaxID=196820 RepID=UPI00333277B1
MESVLYHVSFVLNVTVVVLGSVMRLPQIIKLYRAKSSEGISIWANLVDLTCYMTGLGYGYSFGYPVHAYAENIFLTLQEITLVYLAIQYGRVSDITIITTLIFLTTVCVAIPLNIVPPIVFQLLMVVILPVMISGKVMQIRALIKIKHIGDLSLMSWSIATYNNIARCFTMTILAPGDLQVLLNYYTALILNSIMVALLLYYGRGKKEHKT